MKFRRYSAGARFYDVLSGERFVYRTGRVRGIHMLALQPGDTVLDLGCGTGLNLPLLVDAVGPHGSVIGLDRSTAMLDVARRHISANRWNNVTLVHADATDFTAADLQPGPGQFRKVDAVFSSYAMSVFTNWRNAWQCALHVLKPGGRACIVDMQLPTGPAAILAPLARLACAAGGADITAHPWTVLERDGREISQDSRRGHHIRIVAATIP